MPPPSPPADPSPRHLAPFGRQAVSGDKGILIVLVDLLYDDHSLVFFGQKRGG
jgi:hypothetical protein